MNINREIGPVFDLFPRVGLNDSSNSHFEGQHIERATADHRLMANIQKSAPQADD